tara:strand:- start:174 stop:500 length:327 start_codon:yes stop_codon:yes gene_type:complete
MKITDKELDQLINSSRLDYSYDQESLRVVTLYFYEKNGNCVNVHYDSNLAFNYSISIGDNEVELTKEQDAELYKNMGIAFDLQVSEEMEYFYNQKYERNSADDSYYIQ